MVDNGGFASGSPPLDDHSSESGKLTPATLSERVLTLFQQLQQPVNVALKSVSIKSWSRLTQDEKRKDFELALSLATNHPELFEVAHEYEFGDFQKAIQRLSSPGKTRIVLLKTPV